MKFQPSPGLPGLKNYHALEGGYSFAIIGYPNGMFGASAKRLPIGVEPTVYLGADDRPVYQSFAAAQAACEEFLNGRAGRA